MASRSSASRWASRAGQVFGWTLMGFGVWSLFAGGVGQGLWLVLIGWFLNNAARSSYESLLVREALSRVRVRELMFTRLESVAPEVTAQQLIDEHFMESDQRAFPVLAAEAREALELMAQREVDQIPILADGRLLGLVRRRDIVKWIALRDPDSRIASSSLARA